MARTKTVTKSKKDGIKKRTVTKSNKRGTTTKTSVRSGGKILSKSSEKRKGIRAPGKTEKVTIKNKSADGLKTKRVMKVKSTKSGKGTVYTDTKTTKKPSSVTVKINLSVAVGLKLELIFCFQFIVPFVMSIEKSSLLLFENKIDLLFSIISEVFKKNEFS